jgi:hypothetical protein
MHIKCMRSPGCYFPVCENPRHETCVRTSFSRTPRSPKTSRPAGGSHSRPNSIRTASPRRSAPARKRSRRPKPSRDPEERGRALAAVETLHPLIPGVPHRTAASPSFGESDYAPDTRRHRAYPYREPERTLPLKVKFADHPARLSLLAARSRACPAKTPPDSSTRTGIVQPHSRIDAAI